MGSELEQFKSQKAVGHLELHSVWSVRVLLVLESEQRAKIAEHECRSGVLADNVKALSTST